MWYPSDSGREDPWRGNSIPTTSPRQAPQVGTVNTATSQRMLFHQQKHSAGAAAAVVVVVPTFSFNADENCGSSSARTASDASTWDPWPAKNGPLCCKFSRAVCVRFERSLAPTFRPPLLRSTGRHGRPRLQARNTGRHICRRHRLCAHCRPANALRQLLPMNLHQLHLHAPQLLLQVGPDGQHT